MTPHIEAKKEDVAKVVIMPGDPLRAKMIAEKYLEDYKLINQVRGMLGYTGTYKGKLITVMGSGMGMASIGIYSYELFKMYDVDCIIRVGSCGAYVRDLNIMDLLLVTSSYAKTYYDEMMSGKKSDVLYSSESINEKFLSAANAKGIKLRTGRIHSTDAFYGNCNIEELYKKHDCLAAEMESFSLFQNANILNKQATCILTVSDNLVTKEEISAEARQNSLTDMVELALEVGISL